MTKSLKREWLMAAAAVGFMVWGQGAAMAQQSPGTSAGSGPAGMGHGMEHGAMDHGQDHGGMSMGHGGMGHGGHGAMGGGMSGSESDGMGHGASGHGGGMTMGHMMCRTSERIEGRLAYLKAELKVTEAQTPQWNSFADAVRTSGQKVARYCASLKEESGKEKPSGILQQLGLMERNMTAHLESVRAIKSAAEPLFGVLTDEQKKTAEETMTGLMGFGMSMGKM
ncbi:MAG: hypothetical protein C3F11_09815 [Methylocystaceae bacterium]|nr:MAG: hypothetical protein C3F11_09815 [Methylocystaceae bacterium]